MKPIATCTLELERVELSQKLFVVGSGCKPRVNKHQHAAHNHLTTANQDKHKPRKRESSWIIMNQDITSFDSVLHCKFTPFPSPVETSVASHQVPPLVAGENDSKYQGFHHLKILKTTQKPTQTYLRSNVLMTVMTCLRIQWQLRTGVKWNISSDKSIHLREAPTRQLQNTANTCKKVTRRYQVPSNQNVLVETEREYTKGPKVP